VSLRHRPNLVVYPAVSALHGSLFSLCQLSEN
jgi:hypothetical protein